MKPNEASALLELAKADHTTQSEVVRTLLRREYESRRQQAEAHNAKAAKAHATNGHPPKGERFPIATQARSNPSRRHPRRPHPPNRKKRPPPEPTRKAPEPSAGGYFHGGNNPFTRSSTDAQVREATHRQSPGFVQHAEQHERTPSKAAVPIG